MKSPNPSSSETAISSPPLIEQFLPKVGTASELEIGNPENQEGIRNLHTIEIWLMA